MRTGEMLHVQVGTSHQLDVHRLPYTSGIRRPLDFALCTLVVHVARAWGRRNRVGEDSGDSQRGKEEDF